MGEHFFVCSGCGARFRVRADIMARYPGWKPTACLKCRPRKSGAHAEAHGEAHPRASADAGPKSRSRVRGQRDGEGMLTVAQVLERHHGGPTTGLFTDGACTGNPGPGGWGVVYARDNEIVAQRHGFEPATTNNRMELRALIEGYKLLPDRVAIDIDIWSDSELCVRTINEWAAAWKRNGWQRKTGPVKNLALVQELYELAQAQPRAHLRWIKAHSGRRWNEYADALATAYMRDEL